VHSVFVEGGPTVASALIAAGLVDEYLVYIAPVLLGGPRVALDDLGVGSISDRRRLDVLSTTSLGPDLLVRARPHRPQHQNQQQHATPGLGNDGPTNDRSTT
jgi:diaminohydroxyphosphoribosylaminopyrimidine deaminase/5-amino-6-(5-phosphoribosylamino)uracil reductase